MIDIKEAIMAHRPTRSAGLFLLAQITVIAGIGYGLSYTRSVRNALMVDLHLCGLDRSVDRYVLSNAVNRVVELLDTISKQLTLTPQETKREG